MALESALTAVARNSGGHKTIKYFTGVLARGLKARLDKDGELAMKYRDLERPMSQKRLSME